MKTSDLIKLLERHIAVHGNTYVSVRHTANHEFSPDDDLTEIDVEYDKSANLLVIRAQN